MSETGEQSPRPREFVLVEDAQEARRLILEGVKTLASTMIWTKDQAQAVNTHLSQVNEQSNLLYAWTPAQFDPKQFKEAVDRTGTLDCYFSVSLTRANVFFKAEFAGIDSKGLRFRFPGEIFKVQRRKEVRLPLSEPYGLHAEFQDPSAPGARMKKRICDISASGIGILIGDKEGPKFQQGSIIRDLSFSLRDKRFICEAEVRHVRPAKSSASPQEQIKVGLLFRNLRPGDSQAIASFVFEESRRFYSRFI